MRLLSLNASTPTIKQGEFNSSAVEILVPLDMRGYNLFLVFELPSGEKVFTPSILLDATNMISYALPAAVLSEIGRVQVELQGFVETSYIKSVTYSFTVVKSLTGPTNGTRSELKEVDYLPWYTEAAGFKSEVELIANAYKIAEALRVSKEIARVAGESARIIAENNRTTGENTRVANEAIRVPAESGRTSAEGLRVTAESGRVTTESGRVTAESGRVSAESGRAAALALKADKIRATNLVTNGDFSQGMDQWGQFGGTISITNGFLICTGNGTTSVMTLGRYANPPKIVGNKYYYSILTRTNGLSISFGLELGGTYSTNGNLEQNVLTKKTGVVTATTTSGDFYYSLTFVDNPGQNGKLFEIDNVVNIDLTTTFGAGNEPTKEQMDALLAKYPNSWFDGITNLVNVSDLMMLIIRKWL